MYHLALYRAWPDDRHFDHQVIEARWFESGQHRHLRPRLDLKGADRIGLLNHLISWLVVIRDAMQAQGTMVIKLDIVKAFSNSAQHAETQYIDLEKAKRLNIFLAPLDHASPLHSGRFLRQQAIERFIGEYETARMDPQVPGEAMQLIA